ncbi:NADPH-dependent FMN reductase [Fluviispira multicolorata]|uniref:NADPH-dependent oxidoreductase n=1 Tax=Fluviispira multicolorata TaxID=2654512 RepID=A0A833JE95_9BACT|nr:NAD(P)H-dependent oxidoreductase [Fluviispira multicolorata]KAB8032278.1 NADPH-dependent oxidoreductase [Fluviispira multicolorata]
MNAQNKFMIINGSSRKESQSKKVSLYLQNQLEELDENNKVAIFDLTNHPLPFWNEALWQEKEKWNHEWSQVSNKIKNTEALIVVSPEWGGMAPPDLINFFQLASNGVLAHKPALIVSVSAGDAGSYPLTMLRSFTHKNTKICYIPEQIIIRKVNQVLNFDTHESEYDQIIRQRINHGLNVLKAYLQAFRLIRSSEFFDHNAYPFGM